MPPCPLFPPLFHSVLPQSWPAQGTFAGLQRQSPFSCHLPRGSHWQETVRRAKKPQYFFLLPVSVLSLFYLLCDFVPLKCPLDFGLWTVISVSELWKHHLPFSLQPKDGGNFQIPNHLEIRKKLCKFCFITVPTNFCICFS